MMANSHADDKVPDHTHNRLVSALADFVEKENMSEDEITWRLLRVLAIGCVLSEDEGEARLEQLLETLNNLYWDTLEHKDKLVIKN